MLRDHEVPAPALGRTWQLLPMAAPQGCHSLHSYTVIVILTEDQDEVQLRMHRFATYLQKLGYSKQDVPCLVPWSESSDSHAAARCAWPNNIAPVLRHFLFPNIIRGQGRPDFNDLDQNYPVVALCTNLRLRAREAGIMKGLAAAA